MKKPNKKETTESIRPVLRASTLKFLEK